MVFIDWVTLLLLNMSAGFLILAAYVYRGLDDSDQARWSLGFIAVGLVALVFGGGMTMTWPLPGPYGSIYGDLSVLFGAPFLLAGLGMTRRVRLAVISIYAFVGGTAAIVYGIRIWMLSLTQAPAISAAGFLLSGLAGVFAFPTVTVLRGQMAWRAFAAAVLVVIALLWLATAYGGIWQHMELFKAWKPATMGRG